MSVLSLPREEVIDQLAMACKHARLICKRISIDYRVALKLSKTFDEINNRNDFEIVQQLMLIGREAVDLTREFVESHQPDSGVLAYTIANSFLTAINLATSSDPSIISDELSDFFTLVKVCLIDLILS